jgi:hypothetical protein
MIVIFYIFMDLISLFYIHSTLYNTINNIDNNITRLIHEGKFYPA